MTLDGFKCMLREVMGCAISKGRGDTAHANDIKSDPDELSEMTGIAPRFCVGLLRSAVSRGAADAPCAAVTAAFELFDLDGNGTLEEHEFLGSFVLFGHVDIDRKIEFRFRQIDTDGSGRPRSVLTAAQSTARSHACTQTQALRVAHSHRRATLGPELLSRLLGGLSVDELTKMIFWDHSIVTRLVDRMASSHSISTRVVISFV